MAKAKKIVTDSDGLIVNEGPNPRFVGGRYVEVGDRYDPEALNSETYAVKSTPVGALTDEQLQAELERRQAAAKPAPAKKAAAPDADDADDAAKRAEQEAAAALEKANAGL